jgi:hypothetical protein
MRLTFELGKVKTVAIRERMLGVLVQIDKGLATQVAYGLGLHLPEVLPTNQNIPADGNPADYQPGFFSRYSYRSRSKLFSGRLRSVRRGLRRRRHQRGGHASSGSQRGPFPERSVQTLQTDRGCGGCYAGH